jgi:hypothetical protein
MALVWLLTVALALWFGFEFGRKWEVGVREEEEEALQEAAEATRERRGIRLTRLTVRR